MKLNHECIRDVLLAVEDGAGYRKGVAFDISHELSGKYGFDVLRYHIKQAREAELLGMVRSTLDNNVYVDDLTPRGHEFIANIRSDTNWRKTKEAAGKIGSYSLRLLTDIAAKVVVNAISSHL